MNVIFAPHVDDEVIGCWTMLSGLDKSVVVYCDLDTIPVRKMEAQHAAKLFQFSFRDRDSFKDAKLADFIMKSVKYMIKGGIPTDPSDPHLVFWAPDPHFETHPLHRQIGSIVHRAVQDWRPMYDSPIATSRFGVYTTNMNAPYLRELPSHLAKHKKEDLDSCYPSQKSLWEHDYRYWLFEGQALWLND